MRIRQKIFGTVTLIIFGAMTLLISLAFYTKGFKDSMESLRKAEDLNIVAGEIVWLDEVLTQSTRNYIFTRDEKWKKRYEIYGKRLDLLIKEAREVSETQFEKDLFNSQDNANIKLVELELKSHSLVDMGKFKEAEDLINSPTYDKWKVEYSEIIQKYLNYSKTNLQNTKRTNLNKLNNLLSFSFFSLGLGSLIVLILFFAITRTFLKSLSLIDGRERDI